jgi:hypothetical protein
MPWLQALYIAATIFGVGITAADLFGAFAHLAHGDTGGHDTSGHDDGGHAALDHDTSGHDSGGHDTAGHDVGSHDTLGHDSSHDSTHDSVHDLVHDHGASHHHLEESTGSPLAHDVRMRGIGLVRALTAVRSLIYFCLGFGPVGLFAMTRYDSAAATLAWSLPFGAIVMAGTRLLRRFASREVSSDIPSGDLLLTEGEVTVSIGRSAMGRVRLAVEGRYVDCFARSRADGVLGVGTRVRVVESTDECVVVEEA